MSFQIESTIKKSYESKVEKTTEQVAKVECLPIDICKLISHYTVEQPKAEKRKTVNIPSYYRAPILRSGLHMPPIIVTKTSTNGGEQIPCVIM